VRLPPPSAATMPGGTAWLVWSPRDLDTR
jgi:hypothetical protein